MVNNRYQICFTILYELKHGFFLLYYKHVCMVDTYISNKRAKVQTTDMGEKIWCWDGVTISELNNVEVL